MSRAMQIHLAEQAMLQRGNGPVYCAGVLIFIAIMVVTIVALTSAAAGGA